MNAKSDRFFDIGSVKWIMPFILFSNVNIIKKDIQIKYRRIVMNLYSMCTHYTHGLYHVCWPFEILL